MSESETSANRWMWSLVVNGLVVARAEFRGELIAPVKPVYLRLEPFEGHFAEPEHIVLKVEEVAS